MYLLLTLACAGSAPGTNWGEDIDGDGLDRAQEEAWGTDVQVADSDGDALTDGEEWDAGTDPLDPDTDADGYLDGYEVREGTDPLDAWSRIYVGGWPYNPNKDDLGSPGFDGAEFAKGEQVPRYVAIDQHGDMLDLYDLARDGRDIVVDFSALWCYACGELTDYVAHGEGEYATTANPPTWLRDLPALVQSGEIGYLTVIVESGPGMRASAEDAVSWHEEYPAEGLPIVADVDREMRAYATPSSWPSLALLDEDMVWIETGTDGSYLDVLERAVRRAWARQ